MWPCTECEYREGTGDGARTEPRDEALAAFVLLGQTQAQPLGKLRQCARQILWRADGFGKGQTLMPFDRRARPTAPAFPISSRPPTIATPMHRRAFRSVRHCSSARMNYGLERTQACFAGTERSFIESIHRLVWVAFRF